MRSRVENLWGTLEALLRTHRSTHNGLRLAIHSAPTKIVSPHLENG